MGASVVGPGYFTGKQNSLNQDRPTPPPHVSFRVFAGKLFVVRFLGPRLLPGTFLILIGRFRLDATPGHNH